MSTSTGFLFFYDWEKAFLNLDGEEFKALFLSMLHFQRDGTQPPEFEGTTGIIADLVFPLLERRMANAEAGKIGMKKRYENYNKSSVNNDVNNDVATKKRKEKNRIDKNRIDKTKQDAPPKSPKGDDNDIEREFNLFWKTYPKKMAKDAALKAYKKLNPNKALSDAILNAIEEQKKSEQWKDVKFIPYASTWLNGRRWEDESHPPSELLPSNINLLDKYF